MPAMMTMIPNVVVLHLLLFIPRAAAMLGVAPTAAVDDFGAPGMMERIEASRE